MTVENQDQLEGLKHIGKIVGDCLRYVAGAVEPGVTTKELDLLAAHFLEAHGARSAPEIAYSFPATICTSVNNEAAHGVPGDRPLSDGDIINIDISAEFGGYFADTGASYPVGIISPQAQRLLRATRAALREGLSKVRSRRPISTVGRAIESSVKRAGFRIIRDLSGHGVGRQIHEPPTIENFFDPDNRQRLHRGLVIAVEPVVSTGPEFCQLTDDGWTLAVPEGHLCAQYEHSVVVTDGKPILLTA